MDQRVEFMMMERHPGTKRHEAVFAFNAARRHAWLQKLCIAILRRLGCQWCEQVVKTRRVQIQPGLFIETLLKQRRELMQNFNRNGQTLLIGAMDYEELMGAPEIDQLLRFDAKLGMGRFGQNHILGLRVEVVPWMRGMVVMP